VLAAAPIDWDGAIEVFQRVGRRMPRLAKVLADRAYRAEALAEWIKGHCRWHLEDVGQATGPDRVRAREMAWDCGADVRLVRAVSAAVEGL